MKAARHKNISGEINGNIPHKVNTCRYDSLLLDFKQLP